MTVNSSATGNRLVGVTLRPNRRPYRCACACRFRIGCGGVRRTERMRSMAPVSMGLARRSAEGAARRIISRQSIMNKIAIADRQAHRMGN
jgi:hypothetical protein